jgi:hypothetical protein
MAKHSTTGNEWLIFFILKGLQPGASDTSVILATQEADVRRKIMVQS